jgi:hypothetical protein
MKTNRGAIRQIKNVILCICQSYFWIIRGVCPLHDLEKKYKLYVMKRVGNEDRRDRKNICECDNTSAIYISHKRFSFFSFLECFGTVWCGALAHGTRLEF